MDALLTGAGCGLPFGSGHADVESSSAGAFRFSIAEFYRQWVLNRDGVSLNSQIVQALFFEAGRGGVVARASLLRSIADRRGRARRRGWARRLARRRPRRAPAYGFFCRLR